MAAIGKGVSDEDYWSASNATKIKAKGLNIFDESVDLASAKKLVQSGFGDDDEDIDFLSDDYVSTASSDRTSSIKSVRYRAPEKPSAPSTLPSRASRGSSITARDSGTHQQLSPEPSIEDIVKNAPQRKPTLTEISKLEAEVHRLKLQLEASRKDKFAKIPPKETIMRIVFGQPYSLEVYKSKEDKVALLDEAIKMGDGNAITTAILFMKDTLNKTLYQRELMQRPAAIDHLMSFLRQNGDLQELVDLLSMLGRTEEAAMIKYRQAVMPNQPDAKIRSLKTCHTTHFQTDPFLTHEASLIQEQIALLEMQLPVEDADVKAATMGDLRFKEIPRAASLVGRPVLTTLYYCCLYHYGLGENNLASPAALRKNHRLTDKQFIWTALKARGKIRHWNDIEELFKSKNWFGGTKMKAVIGFDKVVAALSRHTAPREILNKYCMLIDDSERRMEVASKYNCPETIIDTYKGLKDRQALQGFFDKLKPNSQEWYYARDVLQTSTVKWKN